MNNNEEERDAQRQLLTTSFGEMSAILKRKDLPVSVKREAHKHLNTVVTKLTELDKLVENETSEVAAVAGGGNSISHSKGE